MAINKNVVNEIISVFEVISSPSNLLLDGPTFGPSDILDTAYVKAAWEEYHSKVEILREEAASLLLQRPVITKTVWDTRMSQQDRAALWPGRTLAEKLGLTRC